MQSYTCTVWWPLSLWCEFIPFFLEDVMSRSLSCLAHWQSLIALVNIGCYMQWYQSIHLLIPCGLGTNQVEAGGHATPWGVGDHRCTRHGNERLLKSSKAKIIEFTPEWEGSWYRVCMWLHCGMKIYKNCWYYLCQQDTFFGNSFHMKSTFKRAWIGAILWWVTFWKVSHKACEWESNTLKSLVLVWGSVAILKVVWNVTFWL